MEKLSILVVEDDPTSRLLLQRLLATLGNVDVEADGAEGLRRACRALRAGQPYQLMLLDIMIPGVDGQELLRTIRNLEEALRIPTEEKAKIIMASSLDDIRTIAESFHGLCDGYITKPVTPDKLTAELGRLGVSL